MVREATKEKYALLDMLCQGFFIFGEVNEKGFALILATDGGGGGKKDNKLKFCKLSLFIVSGTTVRQMLKLAKASTIPAVGG